MLRKGSILSSILIITGLVLALWWMRSTEEQVTTAHSLKTPKSSRRITSVAKHVPPEVIIDVIQPKLKELQQILDSKNDNDPRLDSDFKVLNDNEKKAFEEKYLAYAPEKLNERGTLAFLIGRNMNSKEDIDFMDHVLSEQPCQSLENCSAPSKKATAEAAHEESINSVTLSYPQIVAVKSLEILLSRSDRNDRELESLARETLLAASHSKNTTVALLAQQTLKKLVP